MQTMRNTPLIGTSQIDAQFLNWKKGKMRETSPVFEDLKVSTVYFMVSMVYFRLSKKEEGDVRRRWFILCLWSRL